MYIYPNTTIKILHNVSLNNDYDHTIYFASEQAQRTFFDNNIRVKYTLNNQQYQRKERGWMQVNLNQNQLWDCTYLMFQNTNYTLAPSGSIGTSYKWFYAFILNVEYVNENVSKINFEIDELQTWMFDYQLEKCYVEREHSATDNMFENIVDEEIDVGKEYYNAQVVRAFLFNATGVFLVSSELPDETPVSGDVYGNYFTGCNVVEYSTDSTGLALLKHDLDLFISNGKEDAIIAIYQAPIITGQPSLYPYFEQEYTFSGANFVNIDGYAPKNKKLFNFPYNYLSVSDKEGQGKDYKWELWGDSKGLFRIEMCALGQPAVEIYPINYREITNDRDEGIVYTNFPFCAWAGDAYQVWLAQNKASLFNSLMVNPVMFGLGRTSLGEPSVFKNIFSTIASAIDMNNLPPKVHGRMGSNLINLQDGTQGFEFKQMTISNTYAKIIDEYFSKFGYACKRVKVPNTHVRVNWTYTKTIGCEIVGNLPSDSIAKIKSIYDKGITFWSDGLNIGNYGDFTNPVLS